MITIISEKEVSLNLAKRMTDLRLAANLSRDTLSQKSGVNYGTLRVFEATGKISLLNFLLLASSLGRLDEFTSLLRRSEPSSIPELASKKRKRGRK